MLFHLPFSTGIFYLSSCIITVLAFTYAVWRAFKRGDLNKKEEMIILDCAPEISCSEN